VADRRRERAEGTQRGKLAGGLKATSLGGEWAGNTHPHESSNSGEVGQAKRLDLAVAFNLVMCRARRHGETDKGKGALTRDPTG
jgi:hypothetical protein